MPLTSGTHRIGPETGSLQVRTGRDGLAARVGHDLLIAVQIWSGVITVRGRFPSGAGVEVEADLRSLRVLSGSGGAVALSDRDRAEITTTAGRLLETDRHPLAAFSSSEVRAAAGGDTGTVLGTLVLLGQSRPVALDVVAVGPEQWRATTTVEQSTFGIKPYRAFFGALRLADRVTVEVSVDLSGG